MAGLRSLLKPGEAVDLYAISVDSPEQSRQLAEKIAADGKGKVAFPLLSDPAHRVIDAYGLHDPAYDGQRIAGIPHPAVYLVDRSGRVAWARIEADFRRRPSNEELRAALGRLPPG